MSDRHNLLNAELGVRNKALRVPHPAISSSPAVIGAVKQLGQPVDFVQMPRSVWLTFGEPTAAAKWRALKKANFLLAIAVSDGPTVGCTISDPQKEGRK